MNGKALREAFGDEMLELGKENKDIYIVDADVGKSCKTLAFASAYPDQHVNVGIAEQNACGMAAGLATTGKIPFISTYAVFGSMRMVEQIRQERSPALTEDSLRPMTEPAISPLRIWGF